MLTLGLVGMGLRAPWLRYGVLRCVVDSSRPRVGPRVSLERRVLLTDFYGGELGQLRSFGLTGKQFCLE